jgi:Zn-dependent protease with chaperone function
MATEQSDPAGATSLDQRFMSFRDYIDWRAWRGLSDDESTPPYAHPIDHWILRTLGSMPIKTVLDKALDTFITLQIGQFLAQCVPIDEKSFPELFEILADCSRTLGIAIPHAVTGPILDFNAFTAGTDEYNFIFITNALVKHYPGGEAKFVVGHECGHIAAKHVVYETLVWAMTKTAERFLGPLGKMIAQVAGMPLLAWSRRAEVTGDRAGLLCCGDIKVAERALVRLITGFADADKVDIDDYLRRSQEMSDFHGASKFEEMLSTHPYLPKRIHALRLFARSELYYDLSGKEPPEGTELLNRPELDRRVNQIVRP